MPHYTTGRNGGLTKYGKKVGGGPRIIGAGSNTDKNGKKKKKSNSHNSGY